MWTGTFSRTVKAGLPCRWTKVECPGQRIAATQIRRDLPTWMQGKRRTLTVCQLRREILARRVEAASGSG
jgi:hypothetical protein